MKQPISCRICGSTFEAERVEILGQTFGVSVCPACDDAQQREDLAAVERQRASDHAARWQEICRGFERVSVSDERRIPKGMLAKAKAWNWLAGRSLMFAANEAGLGKTRCAFIALRRAHDAGKRCDAVSAVTFERLVTRDVYSDNDAASYAAERRLERIRKCAVLLLDDIDKAKWTDASERELFEVLDVRHAARRPVIWTSNTVRADLPAIWSEQRRAAIFRRLTEETDIAEVVPRSAAA